MSSQLEALAYVVSTSLSEMKTLLASIDDADPRTIDAKLRLLEAVASNLSSGADRLSKHLDTLPPDDPNAAQNGPQPPEDDSGLLLRAAQRLGEIVGNGDGGVDMDDARVSEPERVGTVQRVSDGS